jgi:hypothetical protein
MNVQCCRIRVNTPLWAHIRVYIKLYVCVCLYIHIQCHSGVCVTYRRVWIDTRIYCTLIQLVTTLHKPLHDTLCPLFSITFDWHLKRFLSSNSAGFEPSLRSLKAAPKRTPFCNNSSTVVEVCLPRRCIETVTLLLLRGCSFQWEPVYRIVV